VNACDGCLRRGRTLELLAGHLETERARIDELLARSDDALIEAVAGERADELHADLSRFDPGAQRARVLAAGIDVVCRCSVDYPAALLGLQAPPSALYLAGSSQRLASLAVGPGAATVGPGAATGGQAAATARPAVAIVGARRASSYGTEAARSLACALAGAGVTVVSGMALGVDGAAHAGALEAAGGGAVTSNDGVTTPGHDDGGCVTIAVLAGGADRPYPASHRRLYDRIRKAGLVVSELPPGVRPRRWMFPARNRIIAALGTITVVVQARSRYGALVTARHAARLGRQVGAVPGQVSSPLSAGPHALIRAGAELITDAQDVLDLLFGPGERSIADGRRAQLPPAEAALLDALDEGNEGPVAFIQAGLSPVQGLEAVAALELAGLVRRSPGGRLTVTGTRPRS
jgi:DNA processing protein